MMMCPHMNTKICKLKFQTISQVVLLLLNDLFWLWRRVKQYFLLKFCVFRNCLQTKNCFISKLPVCKLLGRFTCQSVLVVITRRLAVCYPYNFGQFCTSQASMEFFKFPAEFVWNISRLPGNTNDLLPHFLRTVTNLSVFRMLIPRHFAAHLKLKFNTFSLRWFSEHLVRDLLLDAVGETVVKISYTWLPISIQFFVLR